MPPGRHAKKRNLCHPRRKGFSWWVPGKAYKDFITPGSWKTHSSVHTSFGRHYPWFYLLSSPSDCTEGPLPSAPSSAALPLSLARPLTPGKLQPGDVVLINSDRCSEPSFRHQGWSVDATHPLGIWGCCFTCCILFDINADSSECPRCLHMVNALSPPLPSL